MIRFFNWLKIKRSKLIIILSALILSSCISYFQSNEADKKIKEKEKEELLMKKRYNKAVKKARKQRFERQTKETQERMKNSKKEAMKFNREGEKNFFQKLYLRIKFHFRN